MIDISVHIDATAALAALDTIDSRALIFTIANAVADDVVLPNLAKYPSPSGRKMRFVSAKQRAYVMAAIRDGAIRIPYARTGALSASYQKILAHDGLTLSSTAAYAAYVRGPGQAAYFTGVWDTHEAIAQQSEADARSVAEAAITDAVGDAGP